MVMEAKKSEETKVQNRNLGEECGVGGGEKERISPRGNRSFWLSEVSWFYC